MGALRILGDSPHPMTIVVVNNGGGGSNPSEFRNQHSYLAECVDQLVSESQLPHKIVGHLLVPPSSRCQVQP